LAWIHARKTNRVVRQPCFDAAMIDAGRFKNDARDFGLACPKREGFNSLLIIQKLPVLTIRQPIRIQFVLGNIDPPLGTLLAQYPAGQ